MRVTGRTRVSEQEIGLFFRYYLCLYLEAFVATSKRILNIARAASRSKMKKYSNKTAFLLSVHRTSIPRPLTFNPIRAMRLRWHFCCQIQVAPLRSRNVPTRTCVLAALRRRRISTLVFHFVTRHWLTADRCVCRADLGFGRNCRTLRQSGKKQPIVRMEFNTGISQLIRL